MRKIIIIILIISASLGSYYTTLSSGFVWDGEIISSLANYYFDKGELDKAQNFSRQAIKLKENSVEARNVLAKCYWREGYLTLAFNEFNKVLEIDPDNSVAARSLNTLGEQIREQEELYSLSNEH